MIFSSLPENAAVFIDEVYAGSTPSEVFVEKGSHSIRITKPFFTESLERINIPGRIFGSLFIPKTLDIDAQLDIENERAFLGWKFEQVSSWAQVGSFHQSYPYPYEASTGLEELLSYYSHQDSAKAEDRTSDLYDFLYILINNLSTIEMLSDVQTALSLAVSYLEEGKIIHTEEINRIDSAVISYELFSDYFRRLSLSEKVDFQLLELYIASLLIDRKGDSISSVDFDSLLKPIIENSENISFTDAYQATEISNRNLQIEGISFVYMDPPFSVPIGIDENLPELISSDFNMYNMLPHEEEIDPYFIGRTEITRRQYLEFIRDSEKWSLENKEYLIEEGLVEQEYLSFLEGDGADESLPAADISWFAADAFCDWLSTKLPPELIKQNYRFRLPTEAEWEYAARLNGSPSHIFKKAGINSAVSASFDRQGSAGLTDMRGNVWEWCSNWYFVSDLIDTQYGLSVPGYDGVEKAVRGGSWVQEEKDVPVWMRGSQPPQWCTEFVGFRPVLVKERE